MTLILGLVVLAASGGLCADATTPPPPDGVILEFRPSYFYPISSDFREIFQDGGVNYQLTGTCPVYWGQNAWVRGIDVWAGVDYFSKDGRSVGLGDKTSVQIVPITLGLKYFFPSLGKTAPVNFYAASGMKYYFVHTHNHSDYVKKTVNENGMGGVVEAGFITTIVDHLVLDLFASYSFKSFGAPSISNSEVEATGMNISGVNVGAGIGYKF